MMNYNQFFYTEYYIIQFTKSTLNIFLPYLNFQNTTRKYVKEYCFTISLYMTQKTHTYEPTRTTHYHDQYFSAPRNLLQKYYILDRDIPEEKVPWTKERV